jgi:hypothetical protein
MVGFVDDVGPLVSSSNQSSVYNETIERVLPYIFSI